MMWLRVAPRAFGAGPVSPKTLVASHLEVLQRLPRDLLRAPAGVDVGRVDEVDAGVERAADDALGIVLLQLAYRSPHALLAAAEGHGAEAQL
jgi:hypothetical protein